MPAPMMTALASAVVSLIVVRAFLAGCACSGRGNSWCGEEDRLRLGERLEHETAADPPPPAHRAGSAPEGEVGLPMVRGCIDVHPARPSALGKGEAALEVIREDCRSQTEGRRVREL